MTQAMSSHMRTIWAKNTAKVSLIRTSESQFQSCTHVILRMGEITLIEAVTSQQAVSEVERNLAAKLPDKLPEFRLLVSRCLRVVPDPEPTDLLTYIGQADPKDLPLLVAALREQCVYFLTFNVRHYFPATNTIAVQRPGEFLLTVRSLLSRMGLRNR